MGRIKKTYVNPAYFPNAHDALMGGRRLHLFNYLANIANRLFPKTSIFNNARPNG